MASYACLMSGVTGNPGTGRGRAVTTERRAKDGTVLSTAFFSFREDSLSIIGGRIVAGTLPTSGPRLCVGQHLGYPYVAYSALGCSPLDRQILDLAILVIERLDDTINSPSRDVVVVVQEVGLGVV